ncbi:helix-turn-helix domain-containing protein [Saccharothrix algeriensis]|uniref:Excisionase family DNA binding protein n=1 Tax=Saccharothrix algeriensis TaxID=173560 RepID=A0ABS2SF72_9PSEU|nr:helix-turn-helix domain-containing protein [Saccharothrix algeriensis]MBM7813701.1 excisionase family DNA binding protein [Saccharothrix algeriensis]
MTHQVKRMHRVKAVAEMLDVSVATIYRAIESGALRALKVGTGKGALRIPEDAIADYVQACQEAASTSAPQMPVVA